MKSASRQSLPAERKTSEVVVFEPLEVRTLFSLGVASDATWVMHPNIELLQPAASSGIDGFTPAQIRKAYGFDKVGLDGSGQTIAIVDAYNDPNIVSDVATFSSEFNLPTADLSIVSETGGSRLPRTDSGWAGEIALDVEWAHAIAPKAKILLVEADSANTDDLVAAVNTARRASGVSVVSMSWGGSEFQSYFGFESASQLQYDRDFTTPSGHSNVTFVASSGDTGTSGGVQWPSSSPNVIAVGGTVLSTDASGNYLSEDAWRGFRSGAGGGFSDIEPEPAYQRAVHDTHDARSTPDVGYNADPDTGFAVYDSIADNGESGWQVVGGTSAGAPQWAGLIALANQGRVATGRTPLDGPTQTLPMLYSIYAAPGTAGYDDYTAVYNDIGNDGYGYTTGLGSPHVPEVLGLLGVTNVSVSPT